LSISSKEITITVQGLTEESAAEIVQQFIGWLTSCGEQDFYDYCRMNDDIGTNTEIVHYTADDLYLPEIVITEIK
jgi:hypothetical protein